MNDLPQQHCQVNGTPKDTIRVASRAVQYGDGVFETIRITDRRPEHLARHLARLRAGCERLALPAIDWRALRDETLALAQCESRAVLKIILARGPGGRGYRIPEQQTCDRILSLHELPEWPASISVEGIRTRLCRLRLADQPALAGIKHLNRLEQVLARAEWNEPAIMEGLLMDRGNRLVEGVMSNVFLVRRGKLVTPDLSACGVAGVMRSVIIDQARRQAVECNIKPVSLEELKLADEVFVCNSLIGIWPVTAIDGIRDYAVGPVTRGFISAGLGEGSPDDDRWYPR
jgi:4-amino-4-deoxychorismate lyase